MNSISDAVATIIVALVLIVVIGLVLAFPVMWLWNACLIPAVSGVHEIGWIQAWGLLVLCGILFKNSTSSS